MDDTPLEREPEKPDRDTPLAHEHVGWYGQVLGDEWESVAPGIYRRVERLKQLEPPDSP